MSSFSIDAILGYRRQDALSEKGHTDDTSRFEEKGSVCSEGEHSETGYRSNV